MDDKISQLLPMRDSRVVLEQYLDRVLWLCGSAYIVREVDNDDGASYSPSSPIVMSTMCTKPITS